jgi:CRISPR/Cas system-associated exonuclease Cas4 (RecB family)
VARAVKDFMHFVDTVFNEDGTDNMDADFTPNPGEGNKNCRFCPFVDICPARQK